MDQKLTQDPRAEQEDHSVWDRFVPALSFLPQNVVSLAVGTLVRAKLPTFLAKPCNKIFVKSFGINMAEAELPLSSYQTIEDVFTRKLQPGSRRISQGYSSPADGMLVRSEAVHVGRAVQAKGITYSLTELIYGTIEASPNETFSPAWYTTIYLAPHNYHRVHTPVPGTVLNLRYIPGRLWPVNGPAVRSIPNLFCRNERLVFDMQLTTGGKIWVVMVGALNVGRMVTPLAPDFVSNAAARSFSKVVAQERPILKELIAGAELGTFMLGSTVVVVLDHEATKSLRPKELKVSMEVSLGQTLAAQ